MERDATTHDLVGKFKSEQANRDFANRCAPAAIPAIVSSGDFETARWQMPSPDDAINRYSHQLNAKIAQLEQRPPSVPRALDAHIRIYSKRVALVLRVLQATDEPAEANRLQALAVESIHSPVVRPVVQEALQSAA